MKIIEMVSCMEFLNINFFLSNETQFMSEKSNFYHYFWWERYWL